MPQLSLYLDEPSMQMLREKAELSHLSMSKFVADLIRQSETRTSWPEGYWDGVYGSVSDPSFEAPADLAPSLDDDMSFGWL